MRVIIVDDTKSWALLLKVWLKKLNIECDYAENGYEALKFLQDNTYDFMITDISMPKMSGFKLIDYVKDKYNMLIIVMSNHDEYIRLINNIEYKFLKPNTFEYFQEIIKIVIKGKCKLINDGICNLESIGNCENSHSKDCILSKTNFVNA